MMTFEQTTRPYCGLVEREILSEDELKAAENEAAARGLGLEAVLIREYDAPKTALLQSLSDHYRLPYIEYDERMPIAPELLAGLDNERLSLSQWFPVIRDHDTVVVAAADPADPAVQEEAQAAYPSAKIELWVALSEDVQWYIQDFLHAKPGRLIGTERTGLAFWRNTMALWRTRLACYRTDLALGRTNLAMLRWGLGFVALADGLLRSGTTNLPGLVWPVLGGGALVAAAGARGYVKVRRSHLRPPGNTTLAEVTAAMLTFLENYHDIEGTTPPPTRTTMLGRLGDLLGNFSTILYPKPASRERTHLARERNVLAAQRTIAAVYRSVYARGRTGLAFIRTGMTFIALGLGLIRYFGASIYTVLDGLLVAAGILMVLDGARWYWPVRREFRDAPRCPGRQMTAG